MSAYKNQALRSAWAFLCLLLIAGAAWGRSAFHDPPEALLPEPNPLELEVRRGDTLTITLTAAPLNSPIIRYRIREKPHLGTLAPSPFVDGKTGQVIYTPMPGGGAAEDSFTYTVQSEAGISAPAAVHIKITDTDPVLIVPLEVDFGEVVTGGTERQTITLENIGGGMAEGTVELPEGFRIEGSADYRLLGGTKQTVTIVFAPKEVQYFSGDIKYTGNPGRATDIKGSGVLPIKIAAAAVELRQEGLLRVGSIPLRNRTNQAQTVQVESGSRLAAPGSVKVPGNGIASIPLRTRANDFGPLDETVTIKGLGAATVTAPAVPPELHARLGDTNIPGHLAVVIENSGAPAQVRVSARGGFAVADADRAFFLGLNQARTIGVRPPAGAGRVKGKLAISALGSETAIDLESEASAAGNLAGSSESGRPFEPSQPGPGFTTDSIVTPEDITRNYAHPLSVGSVSQNGAVLQWHENVPAAANWRLEVQELGVSKDGKLEVRWIPWENARYLSEGGSRVAQVAGLSPGALYVFRMVGTDAQNNLMAVTGLANVITPFPARGHGYAWGIVLVLLAAAGAAYWQWRKRLRDGVGL